MPDETVAQKPEDHATRTHSPGDVGSTRVQSDQDAKSSAEKSARLEVPGYQLLEAVGQGGMGTVYRARDLSLNRDVAVKLLQDRYPADGPTAKRFLEEAQITGQLQHPGIPAVHQVGTYADGRPFLAMKLIKGRSLADMLAAKEPINVLAVFEQIAQAVGYAHAHGVIHRDLKPANVMVGAFGEVQVMDWGLAKLLASGGCEPPGSNSEPVETRIHVERESDHTQAGSTLGTVAFMPPEQAVGAHDQMGPPSDVFGLGAVLCTLLTGQPPYVAESWESTRQLAAMAKQTDALARLAACGAEPELVALCQHCLAPDPKDRPANGAAVAEAVAKLRAAADERARQAEVDRGKTEVRAEAEHRLAAEMHAADAKRRRVQLIFGSALIAILLIGSAVAGWQAWEANRSAQLAVAKTTEAEMSAILAREEKERADGKTVEAESSAAKALAEKNRADATVKEQRIFLDALRIKEAQSTFDDNLVEYARNTLNQVEPPQGTNPGNRTSAWHLMRRQCEGGNFTIDTHSEITCLAWSPDGRTVAVGSSGGDNLLRLWNPITGQCLKELKGHSTSVFGLSYSPDGRTIATAGADNIVRLWELQTGKCIKELKGHDDGLVCVAWSPDGRMLASGSMDKSVRLWDAVTWQCIRELKEHTENINSIAWSPDSRKLVTASDDQTARIWYPATGRCLMKLEGHNSSISEMRWSPDGRTIASLNEDDTLRLWDAITGHIIKKLVSYSDIVKSVAWSPDGRTIAIGKKDNTVALVDFATEQTLLEFKGHTNVVNYLAWSPEGRTLASASLHSQLKFWSVSTGHNIQELRGHTESVECLAWNPLGHILATGSKDKTVRIWDAITGQNLKEMTGHIGTVENMAWSPDGCTLATAGDKTLRLWNPTTGQNFKVIEGLSDIKCLAWNPNGLILSAGSSDNTVRIWEAQTGKCIRELKGHNDTVESVSWSRNGQRLASQADNTIRIWDSATGQSLKEIKLGKGTPNLDWCVSNHVQEGRNQDDNVRFWPFANGQILRIVMSPNAAWSPDNRTLARNLDDNLHLWDCTTGITLMRLKEQNGAVKCLAWSPDGRSLASGSEDSIIRIWQATEGNNVQEFRGHSGNIRTLVRSPDCTMIASGSEDKTVRIWDAINGESIWELKGHHGTVFDIDWSKDGRQLISRAEYYDLGDPQKSERKTEYIIWDTKTGKRAPNTPKPEIASYTPIIDDYEYYGRYNRILKVSRNLTPKEISRRQWLMAPNPNWHREQAAECEQQSNWFATAFHLRRLAALEPTDAAVKARLADAEKKLTPRETAPLPRKIAP